MSLQPVQFILHRLYRIAAPITHGNGVVEVYVAEHTGFNGVYHALKVLHQNKTRSDEFQLYKRQFQIEAGLGAKLSHAHIIKAYNFGEDNNRLCLAMEYARGGDLQQRMDELAVAQQLIMIFRLKRPKALSVCLLANRSTTYPSAMVRIFDGIAVESPSAQVVPRGRITSTLFE